MLEDFRLKVFMAVAQERSFTKAAAALGISQPAVSQNISELEKELNAKLFDRLRGEVALTPQGTVFQDHAVRILSSYEDMNMIFCNPSINNRTAPVRLSISPLAAPFLADSLVDYVHALKPSMDLVLVGPEDPADVYISADVQKKDADLNIKVNVLSDDFNLLSFFEQIISPVSCKSQDEA